jgi:hypothetical protein
MIRAGREIRLGVGFGGLLLCVLALAVGGCGGSSSSSTSSGPTGSTTSSSSSTSSGSSPSAPGAAAAPKAPKGSSPVLQQIYRQFPPPQGNPKVKSSIVAIEVGKKACSGKTPLEVKEQYFPIAVKKGNLEAGSEEGKMIAKIGTYAKHVSTDASFAAGQLAADAYQGTLPAAVGQYGYEGCVYALAHQLEHKLAPKKK